MVAPLLDLLTSLKFKSREPIKTAVPLGGFSSFRHCLEERPHHVRTLQDRAVWLWALVPPLGAARFSVQFVLSSVDVPPQDFCLAGLCECLVGLSGLLVVCMLLLSLKLAVFGSMAAELGEALRSRGLSEYAPAFVRCHVFSVAEVPLRADVLLGAGVPQWAVELTARGIAIPTEAAPEEEPRRGDFPRPPKTDRASMQLALEAARPENLVRTLAALDADVLASSTISSNTCRVRLYETVCRTAEIEAWPLSQRSVRVFAGCLKQGHYRSIKVYFSAIVGHQMRSLGAGVAPDIQRCISDSTRSALRGAGPPRLKEHYHVPVLRKVIEREARPEGFDPANPAHMGDVLLLCAWWMLREVESAAAQLGHVSMSQGAMEVTLMLPVQKNDTQGMLCSRTLKCACRAARQDLCPYHAMKRHLLRLAHSSSEAVASRAPLFPDAGGGVISKDSFIRHARATLQACDVPIIKEFEGQELHRFTGHISRVSGAQWLHNLGVPMQMLQILGRWSSLTILKCLQNAPLQVLPEVAANALAAGPSGHQGPSAWLLVGEQAEGPVVLDDSDGS